eukprot:CAMPEP_0174360396 /NCGR_PEP_ID=MMETSP0811_2-20130205/53949_1 /TAXON_ID=73025 ORGANISM="Eutreptiella gymnastica-like, Strain CCMP1594" /NCGR_SAMPLE_ID=MMETSP0811_2 /ASSEMBLY_ACC=CAM_ASM_000667 /LENGTH=239 /DNA_ID=CAMNT_0015496067 /DNA_START=181 /DNA_END=900 /DNA_ORIENTATION=+
MSSPAAEVAGRWPVQYWEFTHDPPMWSGLQSPDGRQPRTKMLNPSADMLPRFMRVDTLTTLGTTGEGESLILQTSEEGGLASARHMHSGYNAPLPTFEGLHEAVDRSSLVFWKRVATCRSAHFCFGYGKHCAGRRPRDCPASGVSADGIALQPHSVTLLPRTAICTSRRNPLQLLMALLEISTQDQWLLEEGHDPKSNLCGTEAACGTMAVPQWQDNGEWRRQADKCTTHDVRHMWQKS